MRIKLNEIAVDPRYQVRKEVNDFHVSKLTQVLKVGEDFKDEMVILPNKTLLCGFARHKAYSKVFGKEVEVNVSVYNAKDFDDAFAFAVKDNIAHGWPLYEIDKQLIRDHFMASGWTNEQISKLICISLERFQKWDDRRVIVSDTSEDDNSETTIPAKKRPTKYGHGLPRKLTRTQYESHMNSHCSPTVFHIGKIMNRISDGTIETNKETEKALGDLAQMIFSYLKEV